MTYFAPSRQNAIVCTPRRTGLRKILAVWRQRQNLKKLDADALKDIGVSRTKAMAEANRPIWDVPNTWRS